ncbi:MAG TPA: DUF423 domain-containing protein [Allosphingosinicella sp.]|jgi:uncharacterized membrane protein YgdD (TMEM256/DUF423 family)
MSETQKADGTVLAAGAILAGLGVALGAFGAHGLKATLGPAELGWWQTAVQYQMWHALALVALGLSPLRARAAAWLFALGILFFAGSLYLMALTGLRALGAVTPIGGLLMILGWAALALAALKGRG